MVCCHDERFETSPATYHEIALLEPDTSFQLLSHSMCSRPLNLIPIVVQTDHLTTSESRYLSSRLSHSAADIEDSHGSVDANPVSEVVLMAG